MTTMNADALKNDLTNPQRTYMWEVLVPTPVGEGEAQDFLIRCQSTSIPERSVGTIVVPFKQSAGVVYPGKLTYTHTWDCTFIEGEDKKVFNAIYSWQQKIVHDRTNLGVGDFFVKTDIYLTLLSTQGEKTMRIKLVGAFPSVRGDVALNYDDEGNVLYPVTWSYDHWEEAD